MRMTVNIDFKTITSNLAKARAMLATTDSMATAEACNMYIDLCIEIAQNREKDTTEKIMNRLEEEYHDSGDHVERHSIAGHMNDPSETQQKAFDKENKDE